MTTPRDTPAPPRWLTPAEDRAWRGYRRMRLLLDLRISRDLAESSGLSEPDYDVLSNLSETPSHRARLSELATHMRWSSSRLSHHLSRMERRGLVTRRPSEDDGRGSVVVLTEEGLRTIELAAPGHVASVRRHLIDRLDADQLRMLGDIADMVLDHLGDDDSPASGS